LAGVTAKEAVAAGLGQLGDVVAGGEHLGAGPGAQDHHPRLGLAKRVQRRDDLLDQSLAQRVAAALVVEGEGEGGDRVVGDLGQDVGHGSLLPGLLDPPGIVRDGGGRRERRAAVAQGSIEGRSFHRRPASASWRRLGRLSRRGER
jgi:hypothetical protein